MKTVLTGVKPTGSVHIGNYLGAVKQALATARNRDYNSLFFIADNHAMTSYQKPKDLNALITEHCASWIALGLDTDKTILYRQSQVPEVFELAWILSCVTSKGLMNRAHAYKDIVSANEQAGKKDLDDGVNMGLYTYPILMASDILCFDTDVVPVGEDQKQHLEICRDIANKINNTYGECLKVPEVKIEKNVAIVPGLDGQKMSKRYNNTIPIFVDSKKMRKLVMKIKTDSSEPNEPKDPNTSSVMDLYKLFASTEQVNALSERYRAGIGWGDAKQELFEVMDNYFAGPRIKYNELINDRENLNMILDDGAQRARKIANAVLTRVKEAVGLKLY